jgi:hypothetical protein
MVVVIEVVGVVVVALLALLWRRGTSLYKAHRRNGFHPSRPPVTRDREKLFDQRGNRFERSPWGLLPKHGKDAGYRKGLP